MNRKEDKGIRTFIALDLPPAELESIKTLQDELRRKVEGVRWVKSESLHLTLKFLGNVREETVEALCSVLNRVCENHESFRLLPSHVGAFPRLDRPRVIWLGMEGSLEVLERLWKDLEKGCSSLGFEKEKRPFSPHLTLGRAKDVKKVAVRLPRVLKELETVTFEPFRVPAVHLYRSELRPDGAVYTKIKSFPLGGET